MTRLQAKVEWKEGMTFVGHMGQHSVLFDGYSALGPSPMELFLAATGACTAMLVKQALEVMRQKADTIEVQLLAEKAKDSPEVFKQLSIEFSVRGQVSQQALEKAVRLVEEKYCSATVMLREGKVPIVTSAKIQ